MKIKKRVLIQILISFTFILALSGISVLAQELTRPISPLADPSNAPEPKSGPSAYEILEERRLKTQKEKEATPPSIQSQSQTSVPYPSFPPTQTPTGFSQELINPEPIFTFNLPDPLEVGSATFSENLEALGKTSLGPTTISGPLAQDGTLILDGGNSINVVGGTLYLQSLNLGEIDFLAGKMKLDQDGNLTLAGNLKLGGDLRLGGFITASGLTTDIISPMADSDLRIQLGTPEATSAGFFRQEGRLIITNRKDEEQLYIDEGGDLSTLGKISGENMIVRNQTSTSDLNVRRDLTVGGRAEFETLAAKQYIRGQEAILDKGLRINPSAARPDQEPGSGATVGQDVIPAGVFSYSIENAVVNQGSLIYLTPAGSLEGQALFIRSIAPGRSFTVGIDYPLASPVPFNWLIIN